MTTRVLFGTKYRRTVAIGISLAALPYEDGMITRASQVELPTGEGLNICSAEDLLIMKVFSGRAIDIGDVETVVIRQPVLNWT